MSTDKQAKPIRFERRWPVALTISLVIALLAILPDRQMLTPRWLSFVVGGAVLAPMLAVGLTGAREPWRRIERTVVLAFVLYGTLATIVNMAALIQGMVLRSREVGGLELLTSSIALWVVNVLMFSLLYWQLDRDGPEARVNHSGRLPDWLFPQEGAPSDTVAAGWGPSFVDYLFLSYSTATAFSTTDVMPLTQRAKLLMMLESGISLMTIVVVGARAINILGG
jgi:uncharacterized membrane protein